MSAPINVALIGYGYAGRTLHVPLIQATPGLRLTVVASSRPEAAHAALPEVVVIADPQAALAHPDIELVVIASPNATHAPLAAAALEAGKHVVVDKPFTLTLADARDLAASAEERGRLLSVFHNRRWDSDFLALRALLADGRLGEITHFESRFDRYRPAVRDRWRERAEAGGGIWYDLGAHLVDQALQLFGLPQRVSAQLCSQRVGATADDWALAQLDYGRLQVTLSASMLVGGGMPRFAVHGLRGSWVKYGLDSQESQLLAGMTPGSSGWGAEAEPACRYPGDGSRVEEPLPAGDYRRYYAAVAAAIRGEVPNPVTPAQAIAVMAVLETARAAAELGRSLPLPLTDVERGACQ